MQHPTLSLYTVYCGSNAGGDDRANGSPRSACTDRHKPPAKIRQPPSLPLSLLSAVLCCAVLVSSPASRPLRLALCASSSAEKAIQPIARSISHAALPIGAALTLATASRQSCAWHPQPSRQQDSEQRRQRVTASPRRRLVPSPMSAIPGPLLLADPSAGPPHCSMAPSLCRLSPECEII